MEHEVWWKYYILKFRVYFLKWNSIFSTVYFETLVISSFSEYQYTHIRNTRIPRYIQNYLIFPNEIFFHLLLFSLFLTFILYQNFIKYRRKCTCFFFWDYSQYISNRWLGWNYRFVWALIANRSKLSTFFINLKLFLRQ